MKQAASTVADVRSWRRAVPVEGANSPLVTLDEITPDERT